MSTIINNPSEGNGSTGASGVIIGAVVVVLVLIVVIIFSLPYIRERIDAMSNPGTPVINVELPNPPAPSPAPAE